MSCFVRVAEHVRRRHPQHVRARFQPRAAGIRRAPQHGLRVQIGQRTSRLGLLGFKPLQPRPVRIDILDALHDGGRSSESRVLDRQDGPVALRGVVDVGGDDEPLTHPDFIRRVDVQLIAPRSAGRLELHLVAGAVDLQQHPPVGLAVAHHRVRDAVLVRRSLPPRPAGRPGDHVVVRLVALPAAIGPEKDVRMPVPVRTHGERIRSVLEHLEQRFEIADLHHRDVHHHDDQPIPAHMLERRLDERELSLGQRGVVAAPALLVQALVDDVVQHDEVGRAVVERVRRRPVDTLKRLIGVAIEGVLRIAAVRRVEVHVVVAVDVVPGDADRPDGLVQRRVQHHVVAHDVTQRHTESGIERLILRDHLRDDVSREFVDLLDGVRLGIAKENHAEPVRLIAAHQREVECFPPEPTRRGLAGVLHLRRTLRLIHVRKPWEVVAIDRGHPPARLDDEDGFVVVKFERVATIRIRQHDVFTVGDADVRQRRLGCLAHTVAVEVFEDDALGNVLRGGGRGDQNERQKRVHGTSPCDGCPNLRRRRRRSVRIA
jgi:hypothetical protein